MNETKPGHDPLNRRRLLRGTAVAGAGAVVGGAMLTNPAQAAIGDSLVLGQTNEAAGEEALTAITTANSDEATLTLANPLGSPLRLMPGTSDSGTVRPGQLSIIGGDLRIESSNGRPSAARTTGNATMLVPITPVRVLDTRIAGGRQYLVNGATGIDNSGRVAANTTLILRLDHLVLYAKGLFGNVTMTRTTRSGYLTVWGTGSRPNASTLNWWAGGQTLANGVITQIGSYADGSGTVYPLVIAIYARQPAAIILDVTAFITPDPSYLTDIALGTTSVAMQQVGRDRTALSARTTTDRQIVVD